MVLSDALRVTVPDDCQDDGFGSDRYCIRAFARELFEPVRRLHIVRVIKRLSTTQFR